MPSFIWNTNPQDAMDNPYEYRAQEQFIREATSVLNHISCHLEKLNMTFKVDERTLKKALWMLYNDVMTSLMDIIESLKNKKHRIAGKLIRDVIESMDLATYFISGEKETLENIEKWFDDEIISHRIYRNYIGGRFGEKEKEKERDHYRIISKFSHRTYKILSYGYVLGRDEYIVYDGHGDNDILVLPQTISMYHAILADLLILFTLELEKYNFINKKDLQEIWDSSFEEEVIPRRFTKKTFIRTENN